MQKNITNKKTPDIKKLHSIILNIYAVFKEICEKNHLRYFAISGTTIGAALWNGIIPWDDDIDIAMPIEDYEKFIKLAAKFLPNHLEIQEYPWFGCKLHDNRTTFTNIYYASTPKRYNGVFIDIVPIFALPNDEKNRNQIIQKLNKYRENALLKDCYNITKDSLTTQELKDLRKSILHSYEFGTTNFVMDFSDPRYVLKSTGFETPIITQFENTTIPISSNWKEDLQIQYKDFQKYPPQHKRNSFHQSLSIIDLKTSYSVYAKEYTNLPEWVKNIIEKQHILESQNIITIYQYNDKINSLNQENFELKHENTFLQKSLELATAPVERKSFLRRLRKKPKTNS